MNCYPPHVLYQIKVTLAGIEPPIWRRIVVSAESTLYDLHAVLQRVMGWEDSHLHDFAIGKQRYSPDPEGWGEVDERSVRLADVVKPRGRMIYQYDFGDSWRHEVRVEKTLQDGDAPVCVAGARACPPEDCGGSGAYAEILAGLARGDLDPQIADWLPQDFDPERFDIDRVNAALSSLRSPARSSRGGTNAKSRARVAQAGRQPARAPRSPAPRSPARRARNGKE